LDHPYPGLAVVFLEAGQGVERDDLGAWLEDEHVPALIEGSSAAMALGFTPVPIPDDAPADVPRIAADERRVLVLLFLEADPREEWASRWATQAEVVSGGGLGSVVWASPFIPTLPGTDTFTDQLR
ncbi:MAG: hypothetical protein WD770_10150, partial [Actinomycetota bacterium]